MLIYSLLLLFTLQLISVYLVQSLEQYYLNNFRTGLEYQARLLGSLLEPLIQEKHQSVEDIAPLVKEFSGFRGMEIDILDSYAHIIGTSKSQSLIGGRLLRDEVTRALAGELSEAIRFDPSAKERRYYLAFPLGDKEAIAGIVYLNDSLNKVDTVLNQIKLILLSGFGFALAVSFLLGAILAKTITTPIQAITRQAELMARGDFSKKINIQSIDEIGRLGVTFNHLAGRLDQNIKKIFSEKSKIEAMINHMNDGVVALDGKGRLIHINPAAQEFLKETMGKNFQPGLSGFPLLKKMIGAEQLDRFIGERDPLTIDISREEPAKAIKITLVPFRAEEGHSDGILVVLHDVTVERELSRQQQEFVADVSHELRTPLTTIKSYVETLLDGAAADPVVCDRFLNVLSRETDRMVDLVRDLLALSGLGYSKVELQKTKVDLLELVKDAVEQSKQKAGLEFSKIEVAVPSGLPPIWVDREKIMRVFLNLLNNALKYAASGAKIRIGAMKANRDGWLKVFIEDDGPGIPQEDLDRIFERFYRVEKTRSRDYGGTGLGLPIARRVIEAHGGEIELESAVGKGTKAWFVLPVAIPKEGGETAGGTH